MILFITFPNSISQIIFAKTFHSRNRRFKEPVISKSAWILPRWFMYITHFSSRILDEEVDATHTYINFSKTFNGLILR